MGTGGRHSQGGPSATPAAMAATRTGLPLRRYSVPEVVMRKASLRQRAAAQEPVDSPKKHEKGNPAGKQTPPPPPQQEDPKPTKNISVISERSVVKCETTSQCFSMTLSSSTTTECKVSVTSDVPKIPEPCSKTSEKKHTQVSKDEAGDDPSRLDTITERSCSTTVENSDTATKEMTEEDQEVQHIMSDKRGSTPACCRRHRRVSPSPCSASPPCDVSPEIAGSPTGKNRPDSVSSSATLDQSVSERSSSTQDSTLSVRSEADSPCEGRQRRSATPYNRFDKKAVIRDVCGNKVHVLSETSSFIVFETPSPSPSPSPPCHPYLSESCCCVCTCCKKCERDCNVRTKRISQTTQTTEDKTTSVNTRDRRSTNVKLQTEHSSVIVDSTVDREAQNNDSKDYVPDLFGVDSNGNVTFCSTGVETQQQESIPKSHVQTKTEGGSEETKPKDTYLVKTETIEKWENDKREWTEKRVSHGVQHQSAPPVRDAKTYTLSNKINIANNNPTLVASEIVEIPLYERHAFCANNDQNTASTCPMCQEEKKEVTLPSIKTSNDTQNEADFWNKLMGQSARAQTNIPKIGETQLKESTSLTGEDLYPWSKLPEKSESTAVDATTTVDGTEATVVPRYSAVPRTVSMLVNTSSAEVSDSDSECLSCADSLESIHVPRKSNKHDSKPVRGHLLLAESVPKNDASRVKPPKVYFIRLSEDEGVVEGDLTPVSECMPEKLKEKLVERHSSVRHTEHCRHHEAEKHRHRSAHYDRHQVIPHEETRIGSPQHKSMASQAVIKECATKSTSTQRSRSKREVPAIVRVHKCHLEEDVRPMFKAKPYKGVTASTLKAKTSKQPTAPPEPPKPEPKSKPRKKPAVSHSEATVKVIQQHKQDQSTCIEETSTLDEKPEVQPSRDTQTTPSTRKEDAAKATQKLHNFNHAMQTQTTPPRSVETLTVNLDESSKFAKSSQTEMNKSRPSSRQTSMFEKTKKRDGTSSPAVKAESRTPSTKVTPRQTRTTSTETPRRKDAPKTTDSISETESILVETSREGTTADRKLELSPPTPQRLMTPRRSGSLARFRHKFPVIPEEQREVSPSSPNRGCPQRRSPAVITSLNAMSQTEATEPNDAAKSGRVSSCSNTDGPRSTNDHDSKPMQFSMKVRTSPDFNSQSQQTDALPLASQSKQPMHKTSGGTQTDRADTPLATQTTLVHQSSSVDAATSTETRKSDASTSTLTPRSSVLSASTIQKEMTKTSTTIQKETTKSTSTHSTDTIIQKETTKSTSTQSSPPETASTKLPPKSDALPSKLTQVVTKPAAVTKQSTTVTSKLATNTKTSIASTNAGPAAPKHAASAASSTSTKTKDVAPPAAHKAAVAPGKPSASATPTERTRGSWASRAASVDSNAAYSRRKAAAVEHVNRLQRLLHHERGSRASLSPCDDVSSGGSCPSDSTNYQSPPEMSTAGGWGARDGRVASSATLAGRRHVRSRPVRRDSTVSTERHLYRHHEPPRLSAPGPPPSDGAGWTVTVAGGSNVSSVVGGVSSSVDPNNGAPELEMRVMIAEAATIPMNRTAGSSRWSLTIRNQPTVSADQQGLPDSALCQSRRPPSLTWPRVQHLINGSASPRHSDSSHQLSVTGSAIKRKFSRHLD